MILSKTFVASAGLALLMGVSPAYAQHRGGGGGGHSRGGGSHGGGARAASRGEVSRGSVGGSRGYVTAAPRLYAAGPRGGIVAGRAVAVPRVIGSRVVGVAPFQFARPYYAFRPRLSIGFGLWAGYPVLYPYSYGYYDPYAYGYYDPSYYPYPNASAYPSSTDVYPSTQGYGSQYSSGYPAPPSSAYGGQPQYAPAPGSQSQYAPAPYGTAGVQPGQAQSNLGGVSFNITPNTAQVFVDGTNVGTVGQFTQTSQPLGLTTGRHRIEIRESGYQTITFEADIVAGQVIPYQGSMQR